LGDAFLWPEAYAVRCMHTERGSPLSSSHHTRMSAEDAGLTLVQLAQRFEGLQRENAGNAQRLEILERENTELRSKVATLEGSGTHTRIK
jgi:hypothetical protein